MVAARPEDQTIWSLGRLLRSSCILIIAALFVFVQNKLSLSLSVANGTYQIKPFIVLALLSRSV